MLTASPLIRHRYWLACLRLGLPVALLHSATASAEDLNTAAAASAKHGGQRISRPALSVPAKPSPRWTISAEAVALARSGTGHQSLVSLVPGDVYWWTPAGINTTNYPGTEVLNSNQLNQRLAAGPRIGLTYRDPSGYGVELSYFNVLGLKVSKATGPENPAQWLVMKAPGTFWQTQDYAYQSMVWQDDTRLHSLEANARLDLSPRITLLAGIRWLQLWDKLEGTLTPADIGQPVWKYNIPSKLSDAVPNPGDPVVINPPFWTTYTTNNLYGVQIGAKATLWDVGRLSIEGTIKAGVYDNQAKQTALVSMQKQIYPASAAASAAAFVGQGALVAKYQLTNAVTLKLGYDALWFNGVALAPAQIQKISTTTSSVRALGVDCGSSTLFQGMTFGLEYAL